ncbi:hypothetical protein [Pedobacter cryoconitis]|nr:hypothetical protein [Pedobacter cryoconitis]
MKKTQLKPGDIFYLETRTKNKFVFGRVLFDVNNQYHKVVDINSHQDDYYPYLAMSHNGCQLIEMYTGINDKPELSSTEVLIPRVFTRNINGDMNILPWGIIGHEKVDYTKVEFPEHINNKNGGMVLDRGELSVHTKIANEAALGVNLKSSISVPAIIGDACLFLQDRADLIDVEFRRPVYIKDRDLMYFPDLRNKIYAQIDLDPNLSYYELAKSKGFDLARFYDNIAV